MCIIHINIRFVILKITMLPATINKGDLKKFAFVFLQPICNMLLLGM